jgi:bifunctional ADP-heptose synthase (sugar kinase/adenylyltransferase)
MYVKGGDYAQGGKPLPEAEIVQSYGGEVNVIPFVPGHSATDLIERLDDRPPTIDHR